MAEKPPASATRYKVVVINHNARPHVAIPSKNYIENSGWKVLAQRLAIHAERSHWIKHHFKTWYPKLDLLLASKTQVMALVCQSFE